MNDNKIGEEGDLMEFETIDPKWATIKLANGVKLEIRVDVTSVSFAGYHDPQGNPINYPSFNITPHIIVRTQHVPKELYKKQNMEIKKDNRSYQ